MFKKIVCALITLMLLVPALPTLAATSNNTSLYNVIDFKFHHYPNGIGYGTCPVYSATSTSAYHGANGKASVDTNHDMWVGGFETGSGWLLVRYDTSYGSARVGYIPPEFISNYKPDIDKLKFSYIEQTATGYINITDNPLNSNTSFAVLAPGETYHILGQYTYYGNWWYIECYVNGQIARGFIDRGATPTPHICPTPPPNPPTPWQPKIGTVRVMGENKRVRKNAGSHFDIVAVVNYPETYPCYDQKIDEHGILWYLIWVNGYNTWGWISGNVSFYIKKTLSNWFALGFIIYCLR